MKHLHEVRYRSETTQTLALWSTHPDADSARHEADNLTKLILRGPVDGRMKAVLLKSVCVC